MAARRLLIVMLILLGISTLAAALVPQESLRAPDGTGSTTTTTPAPTTTTAGSPSPGYLPPTKIRVGRKVKVDGKRKLQVPVVSPLPVGDSISLHVRSQFATQLSIPAFGLVGFAARNTPAIFELLAEVPGKVGILFEPSGKVAARICVVAPKGKKPKGC